MLAQFLDGRVVVVGDQIGQRQVRRIEDARLAAEELEQARGLFDDEPRIGAFAQAAVEQQDARRWVERAEAERGLRADIFRAERRKMGGIGERAQARKGGGSHDNQSFAGVDAGNQRRPNQKATLTSRMSTGTSTSGPMTAAKATGEASPKAAIATAIASSKLFPAAGKLRVF